MEPLRIQLPPGVVKSESKVATIGRYTDCQFVRWVRGLPQKMGGFASFTDTAMIGTIRSLLAWADGSARQLVAAASESKLYAIPTNTYEPDNITPFLTTATLTNKITTTSGSAIVSIEMTGHGASTDGQYANIAGPVELNGVTLDGDYEITQIVDANNFTITASSNATSSGAGGTSVVVGIEIPPGVVDPATASGWGTGPWGEETWGTPRTTSGIAFDIRSWSLGNFGRVLLASYLGGPLYKWDPITDAGSRASKVTDSPTYPTLLNGFCVTAERIVMAWGTDSASAGTQDLMEVWTSAQGDYTDWNFAATTGANGAPSTVSRLQIGKRIVGGAALGGNVTLLWTDAALYEKQYTGSKFVFSTRLLSDEAGLHSPHAFTILNGSAYWASPGAFYMYRNGVQKIPHSDDMAEWLFAQLRERWEVKAFCFSNPRFSEIWWFFVTDANTEPNLYVIYNYDQQCWYHGTLSRTAMCRLPGTSEPVMAATDGLLYEHDTGLNAADGSGLSWFLQTGVIQLQEGYRWVETGQMELDMARQVGNITYTFRAYEGTPANGSVLETITETAGPTDGSIWPRFSGTQVDMKMEGSGADCDFRMGIPRIELLPGGTR